MEQERGRLRVIDTYFFAVFQERFLIYTEVFGVLCLLALRDHTLADGPGGGGALSTGRKISAYLRKGPSAFVDAVAMAS